MTCDNCHGYTSMPCYAIRPDPSGGVRGYGNFCSPACVLSYIPKVWDDSSVVECRALVYFHYFPDNNKKWSKLVNVKSVLPFEMYTEDQVRTIEQPEPRYKVRRASNKQKENTNEILKKNFFKC